MLLLEDLRRYPQKLVDATCSATQISTANNTTHPPALAWLVLSAPYFGRPVYCIGNNTMNVLFIEVDTEASWAVASIGPGFIAAWLRQHGHTVSFFRMTVRHSSADVAQAALNAKAGIIGLSLTTRQWLRARQLTKELRQVFNIPVVAGGLHPTFSPDEVLQAEGIDFACLGEGEEAMLELIEAIEKGAPVEDIRNIQAKPGIRPQLRPPFSPIDQIPFIARDHLDEHHGVRHISTQRGCPFPCTYCGARMYDQLYAHGEINYGRRRSIANVLAELQEQKQAGGLAYVIFLDDTFTISPSWVKAFCKEYRTQIAAPFSLHARIETVSPDLLKQLKQAGCAQITYGVESGSERIRRTVMKRPVTNGQFIEVFQWTRAAGISITANYMLGLPEETPEDLQSTYDLAEQLDVLDFGYFVFYPYPGTELFSYCRTKGYLPDDYLDRPANHRESILKLPTLTQEDISFYYDQFTHLRARRFQDRYGLKLSPQAGENSSEHQPIHEHAARG